MHPPWNAGSNQRFHKPGVTKSCSHLCRNIRRKAKAQSKTPTYRSLKSVKLLTNNDFAVLLGKSLVKFQFALACSAIPQIGCRDVISIWSIAPHPFHSRFALPVDVTPRARGIVGDEFCYGINC